MRAHACVCVCVCGGGGVCGWVIPCACPLGGSCSMFDTAVAVCAGVVL